MTHEKLNEQAAEKYRQGGTPDPALMSAKAQARKKPLIVAFFSGKGGVGLSVTVANLGVFLAQKGKKILLADASHWGRNLHTFLGRQKPHITLEDLGEEEGDSFEKAIVETPYQNLKLIAGMLENSASLASVRTPILIQEARKLEFDLVLLDLGAQQSYNQLDHVLWSDIAICMSIPEPTAIERTYELLRNLYFRLFKTIETNYELSDAVDRALLNTQEFGVKTPVDLVDAIRYFKPVAGMKMREKLKGVKIHLLLNKVKTNAEREIGLGIQSACRNYFGFKLVPIGAISEDSAVAASVMKRTPLHVLQKDAKATREIEAIAHKLLSRDMQESQDSDS